ncbi:MAG: hypothetical protein HY363_05895 [Candidatus Aenigmarchaeota archaeon]|nr:hypothetical protein [Candidatus Aenigmarchaeota archaeon]
MSEVSIITVYESLERRVFSSGIDLNQVELLTALEPDECTKSFIERAAAKLKLQTIYFDGQICYILLSDSMHFNKVSEQKSNSPASQARYLAKRSGKMHGFLLQYLPPFAVTSKHYHKLSTETYHNLEGECFLEINGDIKLLKNSTLTVAPGEVHQVHTKDQFALTLLSIRGDSKGLSMDDHYYR